MDSTEIILMLLVIITVTMAIGMIGMVYFLGNLYQILIRTRDRVPEVRDESLAPLERSELPKESPRPFKEVDTGDIQSLQDYLAAIGEKYHLASYTLATSDGLVIGSTKTDAQKEAAEFSHLYAQGNKPDEAGVELIAVQHHGETVVGIARTAEQIPTELMSALEQDTKDALQHWV